MLRLGLDVEDREVESGALQNFPDRRDRHGRIAGGAQFKGAVGRARNIERGVNLPAQVVVLGVMNQADDLPTRIYLFALIWILILRVLATSKTLADGIHIGKVSSHEGLIHDG